MTKKVAVIGGGIFGVTIAVKLAKYFSVDLYEKEKDILQAASGINQFRIHRGYHYPRSAKTALTSIASEKSFREEYLEAVIDETENFYAIAKFNSKTSAKKYLEFLKKYRLKYQKENLSLLNNELIDLVIKVDESLIDSKKLRKSAWEKLNKAGVNVFLRKKATPQTLDKYDFSIICTYANINHLVKQYPEQMSDYQYELCEKIVVKLPAEFKNKSLVILDGPFMCFDPYGKTGLFLMGNVIHAIHQSNIGKNPKHGKLFKNLLNNGIITNPPITNFKKFIESTEQFVPKIKYAKYVGSMFTHRTVVPNKDSTDERLTTIKQVSDKIYTVFSGKIVNSVEVADQILKKLTKNS